MKFPILLAVLVPSASPPMAPKELSWVTMQEDRVEISRTTWEKGRITQSRGLVIPTTPTKLGTKVRKHLMPPVSTWARAPTFSEHRFEGGDCTERLLAVVRIEERSCSEDESTRCIEWPSGNPLAVTVKPEAFETKRSRQWCLAVGRVEDAQETCRTLAQVGSHHSGSTVLGIPAGTTYAIDRLSPKECSYSATTTTENEVLLSVMVRLEYVH